MTEIMLGLIVVVWLTQQYNDSFQVLAENVADDFDENAEKVKEKDNDEYVNLTDDYLPKIHHWLDVSILSGEALTIFQFVNIGVLMGAMQDTHVNILNNIAAFTNAAVFVYFTIIISHRKTVESIRDHYTKILNKEKEPEGE